jgi:hypothetical protein
MAPSVTVNGQTTPLTVADNTLVTYVVTGKAGDGAVIYYSPVAGPSTSMFSPSTGTGTFNSQGLFQATDLLYNNSSSPFTFFVGCYDSTLKLYGNWVQVTIEPASVGDGISNITLNISVSPTSLPSGGGSVAVNGQTNMNPGLQVYILLDGSVYNITTVQSGGGSGSNPNSFSVSLLIGANITSSTEAHTVQAQDPQSLAKSNSVTVTEAGVSTAPVITIGGLDGPAGLYFCNGTTKTVDVYGVAGDAVTVTYQVGSNPPQILASGTMDSTGHFQTSVTFNFTSLPTYLTMWATDTTKNIQSNVLSITVQQCYPRY